MKNYKFIISGKVQGVYYRKNVHKQAVISNFSGYVKNLPDRTVEAGVTCDEVKLADFISILKKGSKNSYVEKIEYKSSNELNKGSFKIK